MHNITLQEKQTHTKQITFSMEKESLYIEIETENLYIRSYNNNDFDLCFQLYSDPKITKYFDFGVPRTKSEIINLTEKGRSFFENKQPFGLFSIFLKNTKSFIGQVDLFPTDRVDTVEIGCILFKEFQGKGYGTESVKAIIFDLVKKINLSGLLENQIKKVMGTVHPKNIASQTVVKKCGMEPYKVKTRFNNPRVWYNVET